MRATMGLPNDSDGLPEESSGVAQSAAAVSSPRSALPRGCQRSATAGAVSSSPPQWRSQRTQHFAPCAAVGALITMANLLLAGCLLAPPNATSGSARPPPAPLVVRGRARDWYRTYDGFRGARCSRLLRGEPFELSLARLIATRSHASGVGKFPCYRDGRLGGAPCGEVLASIATASYAVTPEELDFPLAYALRAHTCATQIELLLRAIYAPHNFYCLHVDGRSPPAFLASARRLAACLPNVQLARLDPHFVYASASQMDADMECMRVARASPVRWRYFINLAGQELPLKTNLELVRLLRSINGSTHLSVAANPHPDRQERSHWCRQSGGGSAGDAGKVVLCDPTQAALKPPPPRNVTVYKSYSNGAFSRAFVDYLLDDAFARELYLWFNDTLCPEEHYFATLLALPEAPGGGWWSGAGETRAVVWRFRNGSTSGPCAGRYVRSVCVYVSADLPRLVAQPEPFANKLSFEVDPIAVRCLVERIVERRRRQSAGR